MLLIFEKSAYYSERVFALAKLVIDGARKLAGSIDIHGAKNSVLPILVATILCAGEFIIHNCPKLSDVDVSIKILEYIGCKVKREKSSLIVDTKHIVRYDIPDSLMREMRSSIVFLGAIASRCGKAIISFPGGCELGPRPIDLHLESLKQMGISISEKHGFLECYVDEKLKGSNVSLSFPSVGATENIMLAAVLADGITVINNAAREPEICDLANFLISCGAKIQGAGEGSIIIEGVSFLHDTEHHVIPDRIAAVTFMAAGSVTRGNLLLNNIIPEHLGSVIPVFEESGCEVKTEKNKILIKAPYRLNPVKTIRTMPYPGFPTDAQAPIMSMTSLAKGTSLFIENIFERDRKSVV